ncbi:DUF305 domain-containing protein [Couchioplanes caeruleus]|nr:DUF305 domain-containing protein [Couchioplanes caeruleus]ROP27821.1 uncharacterized protein (DUF305 family) [Couchioplanes caeruleus]
MAPRRLAAALVLAATALVVLAFTVFGGAKEDAAPAAARPVAAVSVAPPTGADLNYALMMVVHHEQAVRMSRALVAKPGVPERVRLIADFIAHDQQREIDETNAWLTAWGHEPAKAHKHGAAPGTHGMLTEAQLRGLDAATTEQATPMFLRLMIEHHTGAITASRSLLDGGGRNVYIHGLAKHVINEQSAENDAMRALLPTGGAAAEAG